jgi:predicted helicase
MYEKEDLVSALLVDNSKRRKRQKKLDMRVIMGNPPYSIGQESQNDNNQNLDYPHLDARITETYVSRSKAALSRSLYDSYVRAIRWASDRVGSSGVIGIVTNAGYLESSAADGLRKCLADEFSSIFVFHLRGNQRTAGERSRKEGGKIFGGGSRAPIAISLLVKNPMAKHHGRILFHDIGDYLSRDEKLTIVSNFKSIDGITGQGRWSEIAPDSHGDWLKQRDEGFNNHIASGDKKGNGPKLFENFSLGVVTARDAWCFNSSNKALSETMDRMISHYNQERSRFHKSNSSVSKKQSDQLVGDFIDANPTKIAWTRALKQALARDTLIKFEPTAIVDSDLQTV